MPCHVRMRYEGLNKLYDLWYVPCHYSYGRPHRMPYNQPLQYYDSMSHDAFVCHSQQIDFTSSLCKY